MLFQTVCAPPFPHPRFRSESYLFSPKALNTCYRERSFLGTGGVAPSPMPQQRESWRGHSGVGGMGWGKSLEVSMTTGTGQRDGEAGEMHGAEGCMEGSEGGQEGTGLLAHCPTHGPL